MFNTVGVFRREKTRGRKICPMQDAVNSHEEGMYGTELQIESKQLGSVRKRDEGD